MSGVVIIPAYLPDEKLKSVVDEVYELGYRIIVVDDGSGREYEKIFAEISDVAAVIHHEKNMGKGAAIKSALRFLKENFPYKNMTVAVMDADGQHDPVDMANVMEMAYIRKNAYVLGVRKMNQDMPVRSRFGNLVTRILFALFTGKYISDTQTGLRAFHGELTDEMLDAEGTRYEYEMNVLIKAVKDKIPIYEVPVQTIYRDRKNSCSHFRVFGDSVRIYKNMLGFALSSFSSFLLDYVLFLLFSGMLPAGLSDAVIANIAARSIRAIYNYYMNTTRVFHQKAKTDTAWKYAALAAAILCGNSLLLSGFLYLGIPAYWAKILTEITLFLISFTVQSLVIYRGEERDDFAETKI